MDSLELLKQTKLPFAELIGLRLTGAAPDRVTAELVVRDELCTNPAVLHGGAMMALADSLGAYATLLNLSGDRGTTTIESKTNFFAPAPVGSQSICRMHPASSGAPDNGLADAPDRRKRQAAGHCHANSDGAGSRVNVHLRRKGASPTAPAVLH
jgi:uncharacterized protein (TIGR00369 family)